MQTLCTLSVTTGGCHVVSTMFASSSGVYSYLGWMLILNIRAVFIPLPRPLQPSLAGDVDRAFAIGQGGFELSYKVEECVRNSDATLVLGGGTSALLNCHFS